MDDKVTKKLSEITRKEWIAYEWIKVTGFQEQPVYTRGLKRTAKDAAKAAADWDRMNAKTGRL
jgi:hypothetical protein